jgi:hypothetical protein
MSDREIHDGIMQCFGFANRWTAKVYRWVLDAIVDGDFNTDVEDLCESVRAYVTEVKKVPEWRLGGIDFSAVAIALVDSGV